MQVTRPAFYAEPETTVQTISDLPERQTGLVPLLELRTGRCRNSINKAIRVLLHDWTCLRVSHSAPGKNTMGEVLGLLLDAERDHERGAVFYETRYY